MTIYIPDRVGIHWYTLVYIFIHGYTMVYIGIQWYTLIYIGIHWYILVYIPDRVGIKWTQCICARYFSTKLTKLHNRILEHHNRAPFFPRFFKLFKELESVARFSIQLLPD